MEKRTGLPVYPILLFTLIAAGLVWVVAAYLPFGDDWHHTFRPVALNLISGRSPYVYETFYNPPWAVVPLVPLALLPENVGRALLLLISLVVFAFTAIRLGARPVALVFFLLSPPVMQSLLTGNIDAMVALGFVLPPPIGLFFILIKPQIGGAVALYWLIESWRKNGPREVIRVFGPVTIGLAVSFLVCGLWPFHFGHAVGSSWNASLWPISIPVGLALLTAAVHRRRMSYAMGASPCLSPYLALQSWVGAVASLVASTPETVAAVVGLWIVVIIRAGA
jgi:hypothetical protein